MFKQFYGFDQAAFTRGNAIQIEDKFIRGAEGLVVAENNERHWNENISGTYLVRDVTPIKLSVVGVSGGTYNLPVNYFNGDNPRMTLRVLK